MEEDPTPIGPPPIEPGKRIRTLGRYLAGIALGFVLTLVAGFFLFLFVAKAGTQGLTLVWAAEVATFLALLWVAFRGKRKVLMQGMVVGSALALLLCATCAGLVLRK